ncbi:hypothetical protein GIB67_030585 [Kingdonia uniflora]|uniref:Ribosomal RNA-processing protein 42 n=1 Tax=Kingdonia uniflora TaxID=39325 RepID=A0A7J7PC89_9MAGN|nr:hypothetical protein GIB67_030585 [Kingdonia uniflora]
MGGTDVIASVKAELGKPNHLYPDKGKVSIFVDCSPTAAPMFEGRGGEELSAELSLALQRCLLGGKSGAEGHIISENLVTNIEKAWMSIHIQETTATFFAVALASKKSEESCPSSSNARKYEAVLEALSIGDECLSQQALSIRDKCPSQ